MRYDKKSRHIKKLLAILRQAPATMSFEEAFDEASIKLAQGPAILMLNVPVEFIEPTAIPHDFDYEKGWAQVEEALSSFLPRQETLDKVAVPESEVLMGIQSKVSHITVHLTDSLTDEEKETLTYRLKELAAEKVREYVTGKYEVEFEDA